MQTSFKKNLQKVVVRLIVIIAAIANIFIVWLSLYGLPFTNIRDKNRPYDIPHPLIKGFGWQIFIITLALLAILFLLVKFFLRRRFSWVGLIITILLVAVNILSIALSWRPPYSTNTYYDERGFVFIEEWRYDDPPGKVTYVRWKSNVPTKGLSNETELNYKRDSTAEYPDVAQTP